MIGCCNLFGFGFKTLIEVHSVIPLKFFLDSSILTHPESYHMNLEFDLNASVDSKIMPHGTLSVISGSPIMRSKTTKVIEL